MARIILQPSGKSIACAAGDTVLTALEKAGYALPNNCRAGACGECKVRVLRGKFDQGMVLDMALKPAERRQGYGLMCMAKPLSEELAIEWGTADARPKLFRPRDRALFVITDKRSLTPRVTELRLRPVGQPIRYWPGQYITLGDEEAGIAAKAYSISNASHPDGELVLHIARADGGATSNWIHDRLHVGQRLRISGAFGTFIGDPSVDTPVLCLAAGTGLAPILALAEAALRRGFSKPVTIFHSVKTAQDIYNEGVMAWWKSRHANFDLLITLTQPDPTASSLPYLRGRIPDLLPQQFPDLSAHTIFAAGNPGFVEACVTQAKALGAAAERIHTEGFFSQQQPVLPDADQLLPA
ncbi:MAG: 2Fe-2S iron-sulfur cluster binding domain-containing protein [Burkholderiaceae bacterium]|nr:2Fe-2S iron-sulfur cluster binding domain-containing protein [Burkholderiaceae bacterium]